MWLKRGAAQRPSATSLGESRPSEDTNTSYRSQLRWPPTTYAPHLAESLSQELDALVGHRSDVENARISLWRWQPLLDGHLIAVSGRERVHLSEGNAVMGAVPL